MGRTSDARERLIEVAMELIWHNGYNSVGVAALCARAGVNKGSFYHFFERKQDLAIAAIETWWKHTDETVCKPIFNDTTLAPLARIAKLFEYVGGIQVEYCNKNGFVPGCPFGNLGIEVSTQSPEIRESVEHFLDLHVNYIRGALQQAVDDGSLKLQLDVETTARMLFAYWEGAFLIAKTKNDPKLLRTYARNGIKLITGLAA